MDHRRADRRHLVFICVVAFFGGCGTSRRAEPPPSAPPRPPPVDVPAAAPAIVDAGAPAEAPPPEATAPVVAEDEERPPTPTVFPLTPQQSAALQRFTRRRFFLAASEDGYRCAPMRFFAPRGDICDRGQVVALEMVPEDARCTGFARLVVSGGEAPHRYLRCVDRWPFPDNDVVYLDTLEGSVTTLQNEACSVIAHLAATPGVCRREARGLRVELGGG